MLNDWEGDLRDFKKKDKSFSSYTINTHCFGGIEISEGKAGRAFVCEITRMF